MIDMPPALCWSKHKESQLVGHSDQDPTGGIPQLDHRTDKLGQPGAKKQRGRRKLQLLPERGKGLDQRKTR